MSGALAASVGQNGVNNREDVGKVQQLLNIHYKNHSAFRAKIKKNW